MVIYIFKSMKKNLLYLTFSLFLFSGIKAQTTGNWNGILLSTDGTNGLNGVKAFYKVTTCNNNEVIELKFINTNNYTVKAGWKDIIVTKANNNLSGNDRQDSLTLAPHAEIAGDCSGNNAELTVKLSDFGTDVYDFKTFLASGFDFIVIH
jgi:hypothetical protein